MRFVPALILLLLGQAALAAAEQHPHGAIPWRLIFWQVFNLAILFGGLFYYVKQPTVDFFRQRRSKYVEAATKSQLAREAAEKQYFEIKNKIEYLDQAHDENVARAEAEAAELRNQLLREANELSARIKTEAQNTARLEILKARQELHEKFVAEAVTAARSVLSKDIGAQDHGRLQADFAKNIETVRP